MIHLIGGRPPVPCSRNRSELINAIWLGERLRHREWSDKSAVEILKRGLDLNDTVTGTLAPVGAAVDVPRAERLRAKASLESALCPGVATARPTQPLLCVTSVSRGSLRENLLTHCQLLTPCQNYCIFRSC